ncbi:MAG TPA: hypothetical protein VKU41_32335, partial [Polyangiaceae bacterium]|nr:hypothetical protein [Polyangiaceae bacterium]
GTLAPRAGEVHQFASMGRVAWLTMAGLALGACSGSAYGPLTVPPSDSIGTTGDDASEPDARTKELASSPMPNDDAGDDGTPVNPAPPHDGGTQDIDVNVGPVDATEGGPDGATAGSDGASPLPCNPTTCRPAMTCLGKPCCTSLGTCGCMVLGLLACM